MSKNTININHDELSKELRINKFLSEKGICSRREADRFVEQKKVTVNGIIAEIGTKISETDEVKLHGKLISEKPKPIYIALNKPVGIVSTTDKKEPNSIVKFINHPQRIFPIGRLDKDSEGLIFLTSDGDIVNKILRAGNNHEKEYIVTVDRQITDKFIKAMSNGIPILETVTKPCKVFKEQNFVFRILLTQGLNRQIRRMCEYLGYNVTKLKRVRIMNVKLDKLQTGKWRYLTDEELSTINSLVSTSIKTEEASY